MKSKGTFAPAPRVVKNKDTTTLWANIGYDHSDAKLETFSLEQFKSFAMQRFPKLKHEDECARVKVLIRLDPDNEIRFDGELQETTCNHVEEIVSNCRPVIAGAYEAGFQRDLDNVDLIPTLLDDAEVLLKSISHKPDLLRGMRFQITMHKVMKPSAWAIEKQDESSLSQGGTTNE
jgi:hypothetical protein